MINESVPVGRLLLRQTSRSSAVDVDQTRYDLILAAISWESRCTYAVLSSNAKYNKVYALRFSANDRETDDRKEKFVDELKRACDEYEEIPLGRSVEYTPNFVKLDNFLARITLEIGRPLRVLCDITCIPKSYILFLLGLGFEKGYFAKLDCLYSEGDYRSVSGTAAPELIVGSEHGPISEGAWDTLAVPFFEASVPIPKSRDLVVTVGGEIGLTVPFIEKYEPVRIKVFGLTKGNIGDEGRLSQLLSEPNVEQSNADVCDAVTVARSASVFCYKSKEEAVTALAVGSKPHALGLGIAGLGHRKMEVICRVPKRYTMLDVPPSKTLMMFEIEDRFEPHAYLFQR